MPAAPAISLKAKLLRRPFSTRLLAFLLQPSSPQSPGTDLVDALAVRFVGTAVAAPAVRLEHGSRWCERDLTCRFPALPRLAGLTIGRIAAARRLQWASDPRAPDTQLWVRFLESPCDNSRDNPLPNFLICAIKLDTSAEDWTSVYLT